MVLFLQIPVMFSQEPNSGSQQDFRRGKLVYPVRRGKCLSRGSIQGPLESESNVITTKLLEGLPAKGFTSLPHGLSELLPGLFLRPRSTPTDPAPTLPSQDLDGGSQGVLFPLDLRVLFSDGVSVVRPSARRRRQV